MKNRYAICLGIFILIVVLFFCNIFFGTVSIPASAVMDILFGNDVDKNSWISIVTKIRIPQALTALLAGAALAVSGLMLQTLFKNPLAGPSILGISSGANLGVAIVMLAMGGNFGASFPITSNLSIVLGAFVGATIVLALIIYISGFIKSNVLILIIGMMIGYLASSGISILNSFAAKESVHSYVMWGLGSFSNVNQSQMPFFVVTILLGLFFSILLIKPLNALLLGERYAANLGLNITRARTLILLCTGLLTAMVTAFCGPVGFIGLAVPHIARIALGTSNQRLLVPATLLSGAVVALICNQLTIIPIGNTLLPLNAVTPLLGAPIIIYVILNKKNARYFN